MILDDMANKRDVLFGDADPNTDYIGEDMSKKKNNKKYSYQKHQNQKLLMNLLD